MTNHRPRRRTAPIAQLAAAALAAGMALVGLASPAAPAGPSGADSADPILRVDFDGSTEDGVYRPTGEEAVAGDLTVSGGTVKDGALALHGGASGATFTPAEALAGADGLRRDVVVEARMKRTAPAGSLDTVLSLLGNGNYRYAGDGRAETTLYTQGSPQAEAPAAPVTDWRYRHVALVYDYAADGSATLSAFADGCLFDTVRVPGPLTPASDSIGFGQDVHPSAGPRGLQAMVDAVAVSTYTGAFSTADFALDSSGPDVPAQPRPQHVVPVSACDSPEELAVKAGNVVPTQRQLDWQRQELTAFVHFGMNTFTGREWGTGMEDPALFNPTDLDARQWVRTLKDAGFKTIILTVKHHDGFVLYPSRYTDHSVESSPWKNGNGDVLRELTDAADELGMGVGVYLSPADLHEIEAADGRYGNGSPVVDSTIPTLVDGDDRADDVASGELPSFDYAVDDYNRYFLNQLYELLTEYGEINEVWFDGANPKPGIDQSYDEQAWFDLIRSLQPQATIAVGGPDVRWVGNETGLARESEWSVLPFTGEPSATGGEMVAGAVDSVVSSPQLMRRADFLRWYPAEVDVSIRPGWFYHASQDDAVKSLPRLLSIYQQSVGRNSVLLLNVPPDRRGLIHENDAARLAEFGDAIRAAYDEDLALGADASDSGPGSPRGRFAPAKAVDGDPDTYWRPTRPTEQAQIVLDLGESRTFNTVSLQEAITVGQRIESVAVDAWVDGEWREIAAATTVGYKRIVPTYREVETSRVRIRVTDSRTTPTLSSVGLYLDPNRPKPKTYESFAAALNNVGISNDNDTTRGNIDGSGSSFSAQALDAVGIHPGGTTTHDGVEFHWANVSPGAPDNVVAGGQTIKISRSGSKVGFVTTGTYGASSGTGAVRYTDGTVQRFELSTADWLSATPAPGSEVLATTAYRNRPNGQDPNAARLFYSSVGLDAAKIVESVTLPAISQDATAGTPAMHVFAMSIT